ncbi:GGDEF domain-containing protein [Actinoplanes sp. OR16]|uniref:GGDEF domain-containing protein n=1 Tax=Actinoplanes sp. OR16 TaxID=946334 RepID=UPI000FD9B9D0|nr:GGDEF domain-containing protein [Actinoplanes sp. OR16]
MPISRIRGVPSWWACIVAGGLATVAYLLLPAGGWWRPVAYGVSGAACVIVVAVAVRGYRPDQPATWWTFVTGLAVWLASTVIGQAGAGPPSAVVADALDLAGYPFMCLALAGLIRGRARAHDRTALVDAGLVATSLGLLYWVFVVDGVVTDPDRPWGARLAAVAVGAGDITLLVLGSLLLTTPGARTASYRLLVGALLLTAISDILSASGPIDAGGAVSLAANVLVAAAATHPSMRQLTVPLTRPPAFVRPRLALLTVSILLAPAVGLYRGATGHAGEDWVATGICSIVLFVLVAVRMAGLLRRVETQAGELARLARHDALTGLPNRRQWDERLAAALASGRRPLYVALIDLDHFKRYNDTHGHQAGDELLAGAAAAWRGEIRAGDLLARYGGEEFGLLLTACTAAEARRLLDRLLAVTPQGQTFSAGLARWDGEQSTAALLGRADELLYASKNAGRARITADDSALAA